MSALVTGQQRVDNTLHTVALTGRDLKLLNLAISYLTTYGYSRLTDLNRRGATNRDGAIADKLEADLKDLAALIVFFRDQLKSVEEKENKDHD